MQIDIYFDSEVFECPTFPIRQHIQCMRIKLCRRLEMADFKSVSLDLRMPGYGQYIKVESPKKKLRKHSKKLRNAHHSINILPSLLEQQNHRRWTQMEAKDPAGPRHQHGVQAATLHRAKTTQCLLRIATRSAVSTWLRLKTRRICSPLSRRCRMRLNMQGESWWIHQFSNQCPSKKLSNKWKKLWRESSAVDMSFDFVCCGIKWDDFNCNLLNMRHFLS